MTNVVSQYQERPSEFQQLETPSDVARFLGISTAHLHALLFGTKGRRHYDVFNIPKRDGSHRPIKRPQPPLLQVQRHLLAFLETIYTPPPPVHGFTKHRSIVTNARRHVGKALILNLDLEDFFPTIHFGRVRGLFMSRPLNVGAGAATALAQLCCDESALPQGAPTSPILSNMICRKLDRRLDRLARENNCTYTRYADDLAFSTELPTFPSSMVRLSNQRGSRREVILGDDLTRIIEDQSFRINHQKVRLQTRSQRQIITGIIVNNHLSLPIEWWKELRAAIHSIKVYGLENATKIWKQKYDSRIRRCNSPGLDMVINGKLLFARMVIGPGSPKYRQYAEWWLEIACDHAAKTIRNDIANLGETVIGTVGAYKYDLAVSFASEQEQRVRNVVEMFKGAGLNVFYAPDLQSTGYFLNKHIPTELKRIFSRESEFCVVFASHEYITKVWPGFERQNIVDAYVHERAGVLLVKFDDVEIDGLPQGTGFLDRENGSDDEIAEIIIKRVKLK